ncbi:hypothetical protein EI555_009314 [Monodon monoceros]|uniref:Uncharacterized protein n=1 Tax=Monodon monoceros TaxID=40151 RepID=A0A4U1EM42_MONMO|nr:hypothetical protein EI555_009314 [Monodon monoceros]
MAFLGPRTPAPKPSPGKKTVMCWVSATRSQPSSPSGAGQGRAARGYPAIGMSFPFDGPSSGEGRWMSVPEAGTFPGEVKVEHDQACYKPPSPPKVSPWTPKSPPPARRGTEAR